MSRRPPRLLALLLALGLAVAGAACSGDDDADGGNDDGVATTTTKADDGGTGDTTTTTGAASGGATTTTGAGAPTSEAPPAGGDETGEGVIEVTIAGGSPVGGLRRETVKQNAQVTLRVTSDVAGELHVHTYDLRADLVPGQSSDLTFLAKVPGVFDVELEGRSGKVLELEVRR